MASRTALNRSRKGKASVGFTAIHNWTAAKT
jgi:hypothetical protein